MKGLAFYLAAMIILVIMMPFAIVASDGTLMGGGIPDVKVQPGSGEVQVKVYRKDTGNIVTMKLEEYLAGVVAAEMPADFAPEALKAQAVASRSYALSKVLSDPAAGDGVHPEAHLCTDFAHCQAWVSEDGAKASWGSGKGKENWEKIVASVRDTKDLVISYGGYLADQAVFHSNSGGMTENSEDVWDNAYPYLRSVDSPGEDVTEEFTNTSVMSKKEFCDALKKAFGGLKLDEVDPLKEVKVLQLSQGGRIRTIRVGNLELKGTDIRSALSLRSTNFSLQYADSGSIRIVTLGNGHGVGMSQWGANVQAKSGSSYDMILQYYYEGVQVESLRNIQDGLNP